MGRLFQDCSNLTSIDLTGFDTSDVTSMSYMFYGCSSLTSIDLSGWDTSKVTKMDAMFQGCSSLTSIDLTGWDTRGVTSMNCLFYVCDRLTDIALDKDTVFTSGISASKNNWTRYKLLDGTEVYGPLINKLYEYTGENPGWYTTRCLNGHSYGDWQTIKGPTCTEKGSKEKICSVCGDEVLEEIPELGHSWNSEPTVDKAATCTEDGQESTCCSRCGEIQEGSEHVIPATGHNYEGGVCTYCGDKTGWKKIDGYWYFFENDGTMATSTWKKDSKGWCYLGSDGRMVTNDWAPDSKGWCWIGSNGYMVEKTKWIQYDGGWYYIEKGYRVQNSWRKDSKGWCYLGPEGRMVTNDWVKDSKGWCWIGSAGYMVEKTQWLKVGNDWYYIQKGYRVQSKWMKDSKGWCWLQADGKMLTNGWAKDSKGWCWIGDNGYMVEQDMWIGEEGAAGSSYIIKGYRVDNKTIMIDGAEYTFDADGKLVS